MEYKLRNLLREISGDTNKLFTAKCFMTEKTEIKIFDEKEHIDNLRSYSKEKNYDIVLVKRENNKLSYIKSKDMKSCKNINEIINTISKEEKISIDAQIPEIIDKFEKDHYVFVYDDKGSSFKGLITYADLNNPSLYSYLYILISDFEKLLRKIIKLKYEENEWINDLSENNQREIGGIFISNKAKGIEISLLECTNITQLKEILFKEKFYNEIKYYKSKDQYCSKLKKIIDYRNAIMHNRNLIKDKENYVDFYEFLYDFCTQRKEIYNYYTGLKEIN